MTNAPIPDPNDLSAIAPSAVDLSEELLEQYMAGTLDPETQRQVQMALEATDRQRAYLAGIRAAIRGEDLAAMPPLDQRWERLAAHMHASPAVSQPPQRLLGTPERRIPMRRVAMGAAGVAALLLGLFALSPVRTTLSSPDTQATQAVTQYMTRSGQRTTVTLADGSTLLLGPATSVTVASNHVSVIGEVSVTAMPHAKRALVFQTRNAVIHVLGTRFLVRQYDDESASRVIVEDGRVGVRVSGDDTRHREPAVLSARTLAQVSDSGMTVTSGIDADVVGKWMQGTLVFDRVPLRDVVKDLARAYGVRIRIADSALANKWMSAEFDVQRQSLEHVLMILGETMDAHVQERDSTFLLWPGRRDGVVPKRLVPLHESPQLERQHGR